MFFLVLFFVVLLVMIVGATGHFIFALNVADGETIRRPLAMFDNSDVATIEPPTEIVVEGNGHQCHRELTPCTTHMDCDVCREGLANCQYFDEQTVLTMRDPDGEKIKHIIEPGESYCLALDRDRARSCNPNTGLWILAETPVGFSLLCSCLTPGLVTQLNLYGDCDVPVGCQPNGRIASLTESPLRCVCDDGFTPDFAASTQTPFCRPLTVRDVVYDENIFPRAPCDDGFVRADHPALDDTFRRELRLGDICVVDPCSVDPISGQRTGGRLVHYVNELFNMDIKYCNCPVSQNLFSVYADGPSMVGESLGFFTGQNVAVANACIRPFNVSLFNLPRIDYKFFWGHSDWTRSDDDTVAAVRADQVSHERYRAILYPFLSAHPDNVNVANLSILKFSTAYTFAFLSNVEVPLQSLYQRYSQVALRTATPCFYPGDEGRCIRYNHNDCIRRHAGGQVWTAETVSNAWCYLSREDQFLRIWSPATRYPHGRYPMLLRVNGLFALNSGSREYTTVSIVFGGRATSGTNVDGLAVTLNTYTNYSV